MNEVNHGEFSCFIIGGGTLPIRCAEILRRAGHRVTGIASADREVVKWAKANGVALLAPGKDLAARIDAPFDYLFSIVNHHILHDDVLRLARKMAINFHDAPLPKYAGIHATSWALMNGERTHGVSWHLITDLVDAGDIVKQELVAVAPDETALTLNTKCYEAAARSFAELVAELADGRVAPRPQDLDARTHFARFKRPADGAIVSWNRPAAQISALVRALDFGPQPNVLGVAKIFVAGRFFVVEELAVLDRPAAAPAGTINEIGADFVRLSAADREVELRRVATLDGRPLALADWAAACGLRAGAALDALDAETLAAAEAAYHDLGKQEDYWTRKLETAEPCAPPLVNNAAASPEPVFATREIPLPAAFADALASLADAPERARFLLAAAGAFLARLNGFESFDLGYCGETDPLDAPLDALLARQRPFRFAIDAAQDFAALLAGVRQEAEEVARRQTYALDLIGRTPLLRARAAAEGGLAFPFVFAVADALDHFRPAPGNTLGLVYAAGEAKCFWIYDRDRFDAESIDRLTDCFAAFAAGLARDAARPIAFLPLLDEREAQRLVAEWNDARLAYPREACIHDLVAAQVARTPEATALVCGDARLAYRELDERANRLAHRLEKLGVGPESLVGVCLPRSADLIVAILGVLKAGGAYVPLDPAYPRDRVAYMLEDSRAAVLLTTGALAGELDGRSAQILCLDRDWPEIEGESPADPAPSARPENLAYVIYTSGSTGRPKGVAIEHRNAVAFLSWALSVFTPAQLRGTLFSTSVCFDLSIFEMFAPLSCGGQIVLVENILHLPSAPAAAEVTLLNTVPSAIAELLRLKGVPPSVRTVNLAGEPLKTSLVKQIYEVAGVTEVFDLYGPSEDTTYSTYTLRDTGRATIGRPIANTQAFVLDRHMQLVPVGVPGELYLGGDGLARGYLNRPELTAERFVKNPFNADRSARLYRTGDLVRYLADGRLEYLGRIDNQVKIRGFRIELGEVEATLQAHPAVLESVVVAREDRPGDKRLVAYFVAEGAAPKAAELRDHLKRKLPDYMVPSVFVELAEMPLTPNGKIDRKRLPAPDASLVPDDREIVAHRDEIEAQLVAIWEKILGVGPVGVEDNFFELGGHSLQAVRMFAEIEEAFDKNIPLATLFEAGTIAQLAAILRQDGWAERESSVVPIQPNGAKPPFFCIHAKGGNVLFYRDLAKRLGDDQPFYGVQARRIGGRQVGHATVEEMAAFYIKEIKQLQPEGPYYLGGSSFGGLAAFEIAQQLRQAGEEVGLLALFDTGTPDYPQALPTTTGMRAKVYELIRRAQHHRDSLKAFGAREKVDYVRDKLKKAKLQYRRRIVNAYKKRVRRFYLKTQGTGAIPAKYIQIEDQIFKAGQQYRPRVYDGKMTLFRASNQPLGIVPDETLGWAGFVAGEMEIHEVPGHHGSIVTEPYVRELAAKLEDCLAQARREHEAATAAAAPQRPARSAAARAVTRS